MVFLDKATDRVTHELRMQMARPHLDRVTQNLQLEMFPAMLGDECTTAVENPHIRFLPASRHLEPPDKPAGSKTELQPGSVPGEQRWQALQWCEVWRGPWL